MSNNASKNSVMATRRPTTPDLDNNDDVQSGISEGMQKFMSPAEGVNVDTPPSTKTKKAGFNLSSAVGSRAASGKGPSSSKVPTLTRPDTHQRTNEGNIKDATKPGGSYSMGGSLIGAGANEPDWSDDDLQYFASRRSIELKTISVNDSRKSVPDRTQKYVKKNSDGSISATAASVHPTRTLRRNPWYLVVEKRLTMVTTASGEGMPRPQVVLLMAFVKTFITLPLP